MSAYVVGVLLMAWVMWFGILIQLALVNRNLNRIAEILENKQ